MVVYGPGVGSASQTIATQQLTESQVLHAWNAVHKTFSGVWGWWARASRKGKSENALDKQHFFQIKVISLLYFYPTPINSYTMLSTKQRLTPFFLQVCVVVESQSCAWPHGLQHTRLPCPSLHWSLLQLMSIEFMMPSNHLILSLPLLLLPSVLPRVRVFSKESALCIRRPK